VLGATQTATCLTLAQIIIVGTVERPVEADSSARVSANGAAG
jgi:hypothetical protein